MNRHLAAVLAALSLSLSGCVVLLHNPGSWAYRVANPQFTPLPGARVLYGTRRGYGYQIEVPNNWNGQLVMYAHGFEGFGFQLHEVVPPLRAHLIERGYAWAASSYSVNGWAVRQGADDLNDLRQFFGQTVGTPKRTLLYGRSMGGNIVTDSLETYPEAYQGALAECGALVGLELFDYFLSYRLVGEYLTGQNFGPMLTPVIDPRFLLTTYPKVVKPKLGEPGSYTALGRQFDSVQKYLTGGPRPFRQEGLNLTADRTKFYAAGFSTKYLGVANLVPSTQVTTNVGTTYRIDPDLGLDQTTLNEGVQRIVAAPEARDLPRPALYGVPTGNLRVPLLTLHTTGDPLVPIFMEANYRRKVEAVDKGDLLVQRAIRRPGHCQINAAEQEAAFDALTAWVEGGPKPEGENLLGDLSDVGRAFTTPLLPNDPGGL
jgi:pimeloyl-ACP methyl ester carboxylesterase